MRYGKKMRWNAKAVLGFGIAVGLILLGSQVPKYLWVWPWGPSTGYRSAGFDSGHYERRFPAIRRDMPMVGLVLIGGDERLLIDYAVTVDEGKLSFSVWEVPKLLNRPRNIGPRLIASSHSGRIEFAPDASGLYEIAFYAHSLQGAVAVDWRTEDRQQRADAGNGS